MPRTLAEQMQRDAARTPEPDRLNAIVEAGREMRNDMLELKDLIEREDELSKKLNVMKHRTLPELMIQAGVDRVGLPAERNLPPCDLVVKPFYKANIEAGWEPARREAGFEIITQRGYADTIKMKFVIDMPRGDAEAIEAVRTKLTEAGITFTEQPSIPWNTLTAIVRTEIENEALFTPAELEQLGATVGRVAELKERK